MSIGHLDVGLLVDPDADDRAVGILRARDRLDRDLLGLSASSQGELDLGSGLAPPDLAAELVGGAHGDAVHCDDHVTGVDLGGRGDVGGDVDHERALRRGDDVLSQRPQGDGGRDELGAAHLGRRLPVALGLGRPGREERLLRDDGRALRVAGREAGPRVASFGERTRRRSTRLPRRRSGSPFDRDALGEWLRVARSEDELLRGEDPERECHRQADEAERDQNAREPLHGRVTLSEEPADEAAVDGDHGSRDVRRPLRAEEGNDVSDLARRAQPAERDRLEVGLARPVGIDLANALRVDPAGGDRVDGDALRGPSSRESDFAQPMTPGRTAFESARLSVGSFTVLEVMLTMRPASLRSRWGRQSPVGGPRRRAIAALRSRPARRTARRPPSAGGPPELFTRMSMPPCASRAVCTSRSRSSALVTSPGTAMPPRPLGFPASGSGLTGEHDDVRTFGRERLGHAEPDAGGSAADDRRASFEIQIHRTRPLRPSRERRRRPGRLQPTPRTTPAPAPRGRARRSPRSPLRRASRGRPCTAR